MKIVVVFHYCDEIIKYKVIEYCSFSTFLAILYTCTKMAPHEHKLKHSINKNGRIVKHVRKSIGTTTASTGT